MPSGRFDEGEEEEGEEEEEREEGESSGRISGGEERFLEAGMAMFVRGIIRNFAGGPSTKLRPGAQWLSGRFDRAP